MLGGGTVVNAVPREAWFTVDLRSLDSATQDRLESAVVATATPAAEKEGVGFRMEPKMGIDYSKARPRRSASITPSCRPRSPPPTTSANPALPQIVPADVGSTDANIAVSMGIPAVAVGP